MQNAEYWAGRFTALDDKTFKQGEQYARNLQKQFDRANRTISKDLAYWYEKLAENNEISYSAAKKLLKADELAEFHWTVDEYIKYGKENGLDPEWIKQLENASAKVHISRLEQMQTDMRQTVEGLYKEYETGVGSFLEGVTTTSYYHTAYEVAKGTGVGVNLHRLDKDTVSDFLTRPWCKDGKVFSDRIWARKDDLLQELNTALAQNLITGADPQKTIDKIAERFGVEKRAAGRLIMTETAAIQNEARQKCMKDLDIEEFEFVATLDSHTSALCRGMDGQHFPMSQFTIGLNAPPLHCNCRSCTVPYFNDEFTKDETRAAREAGDTGYKQVPSDMTYKEWEEEYIESNPLKNTSKSDKITNTKLANMKRRGKLPPTMDKARFERMKASLEKKGITVIAAKGDNARYLEAINAEATITGDNIIMHLGKVPSASAFFEEIIHITQAKKYGVLKDSDPTELFIREILANRRLLKNKDAYGFTVEDVEDITKNLKIWENRFIEKEGIEFDESGIIRDI